MAELLPYDVLQCFRANRGGWLDFSTLRTEADFRTARELVATARWDGAPLLFRVMRDPHMTRARVVLPESPEPAPAPQHIDYADGRPLEWTNITFRCDDCGNECRVCVEALRDAHLSYVAEAMYSPAELADGFSYCLSCSGRTSEIPGERVERPLLIALAKSFCEQLDMALTTEQLRAVRAENMRRGYKSAACPSHDYCDANECMADAYRVVTNFNADDSDLCMRRWDIAWRLARYAGYDSTMVLTAAFHLLPEAR